jgi:hypothetical protein
LAILPHWEGIRVAAYSRYAVVSRDHLASTI